MLDVRNLAVDKAGRTICFVPELQVDRGERVAVIGANGCGKSTLLRVLGGLEPAFSGQCRSEVALRGRVYVHQAPYLFRGSVLFNAAYGLRGRKLPRRQRIAAARSWLRRLGIEHLAERSTARLSGGERRRLALARAFAIGPSLLLLDEPLADLDPQGIEIVCQAIARLSQSTVVIASPVPLPPSLAARCYRLDPPDR